jgi:hypothetical protein
LEEAKVKVSMKKTLSISVIVATVALLLVGCSGAQAGGNPAILPPTARVNGLALGDLAAVYYQNFFKVASPQSPFINLPAAGSPCNFATTGNIGLLVSSPNSGSFDCTMTSTLMLYVPVITAECSTVETGIWYGGNPDELRTCALKFSVKNPKASVDGIAIGNIADYSALSAAYNFTLPEDNVFKTTTLSGQSVAYNLAFILNPLSPGKHTIHVYGEAPAMPLTFDFTYNITVKPGS